MNFELISGMAFGIELLEDEDDMEQFLCIELGIFRIMIKLT